MTTLSDQYIHSLFSKKNTDRIMRLVNDNGLSSAVSEKGKTILYFLAYEGKKHPWANALMKDFLAQGADPNAGTGRHSPLGVAATMGNGDGFKILLAHGADIMGGEIPAWAASFDMKSEGVTRLALESLVSKCGDFSKALSLESDFRGKDGPWNVYGKILHTGRADLADYLPSDISDTIFVIGKEEGVLGLYSMHAMAKEVGHFSSFMKELHERLPKNTIWSRDGTGKTVIEHLLEKGKTSTALWMMKRSDSIPLLPSGEPLIKAKTNIFSSGNERRTLLLSLGIVGPEMVEFLAKKGQPLFFEEGQPQFLHEAIRNKNMPLVNLMLSKGASLSVRDDTKLTAEEVLSKVLSELTRFDGAAPELHALRSRFEAEKLKMKMTETASPSSRCRLSV